MEMEGQKFGYEHTKIDKACCPLSQFSIYSLVLGGRDVVLLSQ